MNAIEELVIFARTTIPRFFPVEMNQEVKQFPAAVYQIVSRIPNASFDGGSKMDFLHIDITVFADAPGQALQLAEELRIDLESETFTVIQSCRYRESGGIQYNDFLQKYAVQYEYRLSVNRLN